VSVVLRRPSFLASIWSPVTEEEAALLEGAGTNPTRFHVLVRAPWAVAIGRRAYLPGLLGGMIVFGVGYRHGVLLAAVAAAVAGIVLTATVLAHELGHILFARGSRGVKPRMLVLFSGGGFTIVEGRHENPRGAALFAVGGPLASLAVIIPLVAGGILLPTGPFATALLVPAVLATVLALINLLPVAPMDGWLLLRSAEWAKHGSREEAQRRALQWSRCLLVYWMLAASLIAVTDRLAGTIAALVCATFVYQHHKLVTRLAEESPDGRQ
jgi:Zn-dependent protease